MNRMSSSIAVGVLLCIVLAGCAHSSLNVGRLRTVKKAAIVGFSGQLDLNDANSSGAVSGSVALVQGVQDVDSPETAGRRQREAESTYDVIASKLGAPLGWTLSPRDAVTGNPVLQRLFQEKMGRRRLNAGTRFGVPGIPWAEVAGFSPAEQRELASALGVDALIVVNLRIRSGASSGYGADGNGHFEVHPKAILGITAYDGGDDAFWREPFTEGAPTQGKVMRELGHVVVDGEPEVVVEATQLATDVLLQKVSAAQTAPSSP